MTDYVVTGHMAAFDTMTRDGKVRTTFYRGQRVPTDATPDAIKHNLSVNLIAEVPGTGPVGVDSAGAAVVGDERVGEVDGEPGEPFLTANTVTDEQAERRGLTQDTAHVEPIRTSGDDTDAKRAAAQEKLASLNGEAPSGRHGTDVHIEYLAARGYNRAELEKQEPAEVKALTRQQSQS